MARVRIFNSKRPEALGLRLRVAGVWAVLATCFSTAAAVTLGIEGTQFTLNGRPTFLLGFSYYGALGAPEEFIRQDLDDFVRHGFNWLRVWATWDAFGNNVSAVDTNGQPQDRHLEKLLWLVSECDHKGMVVDITLARSKALLPSFSAHFEAVATLVRLLKEHRNWYLDLANERDVRDGRYVPVDHLQVLREEVRKADPRRLVTASFGGHDLSREDVRQALVTAGLDFLCPHRPRTASSPNQTEGQTRSTLALMKEVGRLVPVHYQEPFRRGYATWEPLAADFLTDLKAAWTGGAAGWCFHNGQQRNTPDNEPRRSFDLRKHRLFEQLDDQEQEVVLGAKAALAGPEEVSRRQQK